MKENSIRPHKDNALFLKKCIDDCRHFFKHKKTTSINCFSCNKNSLDNRFSKHFFNYRQCKICNSLFHAPRYTKKSFINYYQNSNSWNYWASIYFPKIEKNRIKYLIKPKLKRIQNFLKQKKIRSKSIIDIGAGAGNFLDEWRRYFKTNKICAIEPSHILAQKCLIKNIPVIKIPLEKITKVSTRPNIITCFEVIEHVFDPKAFLQKIRSLCKKDTLLLITTLTINGFDLSFLFSKSDSIFPPHHINLFSIAGLEKLFNRCGFEVLKIETPGKLDTEIVEKNIQKLMVTTNIKSFILQLLNKKTKWQRFLVQNKLSSHVWIYAKRK